eukprot:2994065-Prymnesium_polylepis.1
MHGAHVRCSRLAVHLGSAPAEGEADRRQGRHGGDGQAARLLRERGRLRARRRERRGALTP